MIAHYFQFSILNFQISPKTAPRYPGPEGNPSVIPSSFLPSPISPTCQNAKTLKCNFPKDQHPKTPICPPATLALKGTRPQLPPPSSYLPLPQHPKTPKCQNAISPKDQASAPLSHLYRINYESSITNYGLFCLRFRALSFRRNLNLNET